MNSKFTMVGTRTLAKMYLNIRHERVESHADKEQTIDTQTRYRPKTVPTRSRLVHSSTQKAMARTAAATHHAPRNSRTASESFSFLADPDNGFPISPPNAANRYAKPIRTPRSAAPVDSFVMIDAERISMPAEAKP